MTNSVMYRDVKQKYEEFNRKYSGSILLFSVYLHIPLIFVFIIWSDCTGRAVA